MITGEERFVGFEATALEMRNRSGVGHYVTQLLHALACRSRGWRLALLTSRPVNMSLPPEITVPASRYFPNRSLWIQFIVPRIVMRLRPRICHFTNSIAPLHLPCPFVVTVYDMSLFLFPQLQPRRSLLLVRSILPSVARKAAGLITVSQSAKSDIVRVLNVRPETVHVVPAAADREFHTISDRAVLEQVRQKYRLDQPFVLNVSTIEPRKNLLRLVDGFAKLRRSGGKEQLVLVGALGWHYRPLLRRIVRSGLQDSVRFMGYVPAEDLPALYNLASALAFPSLYEGFGLPIVEAMACGTPVLTSNCSAMAELGEGAALLVDPNSEQEIADGLVRLLADKGLRDELRAAGLARSAQFSWERAAAATESVYESIVS